MNLLIPCSGPGTRSNSYAKFHKALIRIGNKAVLSHIIDSYDNIDTVYILLGSQAEYIKQYIEHCNYTNVEFIEIENWNDSQFTSLKQIPKHVFEQPFYYNACDNWTPNVPVVTKNTIFNYNSENKDLYDSVDEKSFYAGISYVKDAKLFYNILHHSKETRNDLNIYHEFDNLEVAMLNEWYDVGNMEAYMASTAFFTSNYNILDKTNQEIYYVNNRVIKLFKNTIEDLQQALKSNHCFPHPSPIYETPNGISYDFVEGNVNLDADYNYLLENLCKLWDFTLANNKPIVNKAIWQDKTWERFEMFCDKYPESAEPVIVNGNQLDPFRILEKIDWSILNNGIEGACHGDLVLDNIIVNHEKINYIDHREGNVGDVFYDICKFYHSLYLHNVNLQRANYFNIINGDVYTPTVHLPLTEVDLERINRFKQTTLYQTHKAKIELGVACIWLSMAPLNVNDDLNKFLFLFALDHLNKHV